MAMASCQYIFGGKYDLIQLHRQIIHQNNGIIHEKLIEIFTTSTFYLKQQKWYDILLFQLFGPVLFSAHFYGSFAATDARSLC